MLDVGDTAPDFTLPMAGGTAYNDVYWFTLTDALDDGPVVLAFIPAAFTSGCTTEVCTFRDRIQRFHALDAQVYAVSVDLPPAQNIFSMQEDLTFPLLSDWNHEVIHEYGVVSDLWGYFEAADRATFVVDTDGTITYRWVEGGGDTDYAAVIDAVHDAVAETVEDPA